MSGGTDVRFTGMTSPFFNDAEVPLRGKSAMYCSPTDDTLWTSASRSDGIATSERSDSTAATPVSVSFTSSIRPTSVPRYVTFAAGIQPGCARKFDRHAVPADTEHRRQPDVANGHHHTRNQCDHHVDHQLDLDPPVKVHGQGPWSTRYGMINGLPAVYGLGVWPIVRPHCSSNLVRSPSNRVPVNSAESIRLRVRSTTAVRLA